jgi:hypothetical protein
MTGLRVETDGRGGRRPDPGSVRQKVFAAIARHIETHGVFPSIRQVCREFPGIGEKTVAYYRLQLGREMGVIGARAFAEMV